MEFTEAKHILESLGYNINNPYMNEVLARFNGNYTGRFKGLDNAGEVTIQLQKGPKTEEVAKALSDVDNNFQSAMTNGIKANNTGKFDNLINNYSTILTAIEEIPEASQETKDDLAKKIKWLQDKKANGEEVIAGEWKAAGLATTTHSTDDTLLDFNTLVKNISAQISSLKSKGGNNTEQIVARIDDLAAREGLTQAQLDKVDELRAKLEVAIDKGGQAAENRGRAFTFKSDKPLKITRATRMLTANGINFTKNEDGSVTVNDTPKKVAKAREDLAAIGVEFVVAQQAAPEEAPKVELRYAFLDEDSLAIAQDEAAAAGVEATVENPEMPDHILFTGTQEAIDRFKAALEDIDGLAYGVYEKEALDGAVAERAEAAEAAEVNPEQVEESVKTEDDKEQLDESVDPVLSTAASLLLW